MNNKESLLSTMAFTLSTMQKKAEWLKLPEVPMLCKGILDDIKNCEKTTGESNSVADAARNAVEKQKKLFDVIQDGIKNPSENSQEKQSGIEIWIDLERKFAVVQDAFYPYLSHIENKMT